jgi:hypothetical protein
MAHANEKAIKSLYADVKLVDPSTGTPYVSSGVEKTVDSTAVNRKRVQLERADLYPTWQEQMDLQYWDKVNGTSKWQEAVAKVKSDKPLP